MHAEDSHKLCPGVEKAVSCLLAHLPHSWQENLFPIFEEDAEAGDTDESVSDLLSANQGRVHSKETGTRDVVLGIETFSALQSKVQAGMCR